MHFHKIVVATDFSEFGERAVATATELAKRFGAELHLVHTLEIPIPLFEPYAVSIPADFVAESRKVATERLDEALGVAKASGLSGEVHLREVPAAPAIVAAAKEIGADLIVVGTHGHTGIKHVLLGSVAERTVRDSACPVLAVKDGPFGPRSIVAGVDFSESGGEAASVAARFAKQSGAALHLVHALDLRMPFVTPYEVTVPEGLIESALEDAKAQMAELVGKLDAGGPITSSVRSAPAHTAISDAAGEVAADLIVTGSHGLTGLKHAILGSVAERTLRHAPCSVLILKH